MRLARGPVPLRRGNGSRATTGQRKWGFHRGSHHVPTQPGDYVCSEMSPCGQDASARVCVSCCSGESPRDASLLSWEYLPHQASSCHLGWLPAVPDAWEPTMWAVQGEWKGSFLQLGGGSSSCASWKVTCQLRKLCQMVAFLSLSRHPAFACAAKGGTEMTSRGG